MSRVSEGPGVAAELTPQQAEVQRAPRHQADALVEPHRHHLVLDVARQQRVVDLLRDVARKRVALGGRQRLHHVPRRMIRAADVADLPLADEIVERAQRLLDRDELIGLVAHVDVEVVGAQPAQAPLAALDDVLARQADVVDALADAHEHLGHDDELLALAFERLAENLLGAAERIHVGGVDHRDARLAADVEHPRRLGHAEVAHVLKPIPAADGHRPEAEDGHAQTALA